MTDLRTDSLLVGPPEKPPTRDAAPLFIADAVRRVLDEHGLGTGSLDAARIGAGHSNVTFRVRREGCDVVLRRPPRPPYAPSTHDVLREARIVAALADTAVPVPRVLVRCEDPAALGVPFYVMEHVDGVVLERELPDGLFDPGSRAALGAAVLDALAAIHAVDLQATGLAGLSRPSGYLERQLRTFAAIWDRERTRDLPLVDELHRWLAARRPPRAETTLVHGDFRVGNLLLAREMPERVAAVLDWEMAALGDPLADLGYLVATYSDRTRPDHPMSRLTPATREAGFPTRDELAAGYAARTGRDVEGLRWYEVLALWKSLVFLEASLRRHLAGTDDDPWFAELATGVPELAEAAWELAAGRSA
jgi:aminoglycoside phosphotransferase (APT) family kinase protein